MAATRVYILSKKLGVKSSAIVKKCQDEGLDVKNHMSAISAGLAATICEWFSEGENVTTVEKSKKVDLKKVKIKKKVKRKPAVEKAEETVAKIKAEAVVEVAQEQPKAKKKVEKKKPEPIVPAGPKLGKPKPVKLEGPQIVRVEAPEIMEPVRRKPKPKKRYDEPVTEPLIQTKTDQKQLAPFSKTDKKAPKHGRDRTSGRRHTESDVEFDKRAKFDKERRQRDIEERRARLSAAGGEGLRVRPSRKIETKSSKITLAPTTPTQATIAEPITVKDLSAVLAIKSSDIIRKLMQQGIMATANHVINAEVAELVAIDFGCELTVELKSRGQDLIEEEFENREKKNLTKRPVVATMLGHVDHGKTSLLDKIRSTHVTKSEAGGITQHISTYQVRHGDSKVTFIDTPGHAAFTAMRARGANMTDVMVLVVAADDGVMPQTVEVINHAKAADVQVIVALNKSDLPGCDYNRIYSQLAEHELVPIEWGGKTDVVKTSAITGDGIDDLLEHIEYTADLLDLKADDTVPATGWVVEAEMSTTQGVAATLLIKEGKINKGDVVLAGAAYGRVKTLQDSFGKSIKSATSSMPIRVTGLSEVPQAGDKFYCLGNDINRAKAAAEENQRFSRESSLVKRAKITLDNLFSQIEAGKIEELNLIIRADVQGSIDVLCQYLSELSTEEVKIKILHAAPGGITEGDVVLAEASSAIIIGFNVTSEEHVAKIAEEKGVNIRFYNVIYRITEDLEKSMTGLLEPERQEQNVGRAEIRNTFKVSRIGTIAGCHVSEGLAKKKATVRLIRDNVVVRNDLKIETLKHFKDDVREIKAGLECGIKLEKFDDVKTGDVLEFFEIVEIARSLR